MIKAIGVLFYRTSILCRDELYYIVMRICSLLICGKHLNDRIISLRLEAWSNKTGLALPCFIELPVPNHDSEWLYGYIYIYMGVDVVEWSRALDVRLSEWCCSVTMVWVQIPSREEQKFDSSKI